MATHIHVHVGRTRDDAKLDQLRKETESALKKANAPGGGASEKIAYENALDRQVKYQMSARIISNS